MARKYDNDTNGWVLSKKRGQINQVVVVRLVPADHRFKVRTYKEQGEVVPPRDGPWPGSPQHDYA